MTVCYIDANEGLDEAKKNRLFGNRTNDPACAFFEDDLKRCTIPFSVVHSLGIMNTDCPGSARILTHFRARQNSSILAMRADV